MKVSSIGYAFYLTAANIQDILHVTIEILSLLFLMSAT